MKSVQVRGVRINYCKRVSEAIASVADEDAQDRHRLNAITGEQKAVRELSATVEAKEAGYALASQIFAL